MVRSVSDKLYMKCAVIILLSSYVFFNSYASYAKEYDLIVTTKGDSIIMGNEDKQEIGGKHYKAISYKIF